MNCDIIKISSIEVKNLAFRSVSGFELRGGTFKIADTLPDFDIYEDEKLVPLFI